MQIFNKPAPISMLHQVRITSVFFILFLLGGCHSSPREEPSSTAHEENWFFWAVDWHPEKEQYVVGGSNDTFLKLFTDKEDEAFKHYPCKGTITKTKWHPTKNKIAISVQDGKSQSAILDLDTDERSTLDSVALEGARAIGWNSTGALVAVGDYEGNLTVYDEAGSLLRKVPTGQKSIIGLDWHPTENLIIAVGEDISWYHYDLDSLRTFEDRPEAILMLCVDWHPNGQFFATGDYGDFEVPHPPQLQYWTYDGQHIKSMERSQAEFRNIQWSHDGELLATASEKIRLWDQTGKLIAEAPSENLLWGVDWNGTSTKIVATDEQRKVLFWDRKLSPLLNIQH
ncbi:MAG: WD40 repeat domain-containing protein [Bacteroidota bacterium]